MTLCAVATQWPGVIRCPVPQVLERDPRGSADGRLCYDHDAILRRYFLTAAYVAVKYRGHWFYIEDSDLPSKTTFALLNTVLALQAGGVPSTGPVLTLPVTR
jgi:hypothetical protein